MPSLEVAVPLAARLHRSAARRRARRQPPLRLRPHQQPVRAGAPHRRRAADDPALDVGDAAAARRRRRRAGVRRLPAQLARPGRPSRPAPARVALLGAGTRREFREEDQLCCAWIARELVAAGYAATTPAPRRSSNDGARRTWRCARRGAAPSTCAAPARSPTWSSSAAHVDDVPAVFRMQRGELVMSDPAQAAAA